MAVMRWRYRKMVALIVDVEGVAEVSRRVFLFACVNDADRVLCCLMSIIQVLHIGLEQLTFYRMDLGVLRLENLLVRHEKVRWVMLRNLLLRLFRLGCQGIREALSFFDGHLPSCCATNKTFISWVRY